MQDLKHLLKTVAFAKSPEHERFVQDFEGMARGRYALAYLVGVEGSARETACLWQGAPFCSFEARWHA